MRLLQELFTTEDGLFAATGIAFMLGMGVFFLRLFMRNDAPAAQEKAR